MLTEAGAIVDEDGTWHDPDDVPAGTRVFGQWDVVRLHMKAGRGEALCWNNEEIRWRSTPHPGEVEWKRRPGDVYVLRLPLTEQLTPAVFLRGLVEWRDWLAGVRAAPTGTSGSSAMSLLRARLERRVVCGDGERPPLRQTRGGRLQLGPAGQGRFEGKLVQLDLPSAYATLLGEAFYGGVWQRVDHSGRAFTYWWESPRPLFVRADVTVPRGLGFGPLSRSFPRRVHYAEMQVYSKATYPDGSSWLYPVGRRLSGVWTRAELEAAISVGCKVKLREAWVQRSSAQPFLPWLESVRDGRRRLGGVGELLVKLTGNALWGRFCLDPAVGGKRSIRDGHGSRLLAFRPAPPPAHDLAEYVSGTTRGLLYGLMAWAGERLLSANTDGAWVRDDGSEPPAGWRVKARAHRLDLLQPSCLRYWPVGSRWPRVVFSGVPAIEAD
ncbi:MAG TPA: hypothetical protein VMU14_18845, partial [Acidimicrobiales bacterium]|nr:hypothetical protein [Acidimicrobiales bacterium]